MIERLHESLAAVCPIVGVSVPTPGTSAGVAIQYDPSATAPQQVLAQTTLATFDWSQATHDAWVTGKLRAKAKAEFLDNRDDLYKLLRALADVIKDEFNTLGKVVGTASSVWDPANLANGSGLTSPAVTVTGAAFGDFVYVAAPYSLQGIVCTAYVSAADTVNVRLQNGTGGAINLASGSWKVLVWREPGTRTLAQLRTAIENRIDSGQVD